jgi:hydroxypyruvate reductase
MILDAERFLTHSLRRHPDGAATTRILAAALNAVEPSHLIRRHLTRTGSVLHLGNHQIDLDDVQRVILLGIGKAAPAMTRGAMGVLGDQINCGLVLTKPGQAILPDDYQGRITLHTGGHPLPNKSGMKAAQSILNLVSNLSPLDLVITLLSGGGSALLTLPAADLSLNDLVQTNQKLLACGADIQEINAVRKHLSAVKGGWLARSIHPAQSITLILSDVMGDQLDSIASGPTVPDPTTYQDAQKVADAYQLSLPESVNDHLQRGQRGEIPETPKPGDLIFSQHIQLLLGNNRVACTAGSQQALAEGFHSQILPSPLSGEARSNGELIAQLLKRSVLNGQPLPRPACLIAGGETTVTLSDAPQPGKGGRNLELALSAVQPTSGLANCALITLASDGEDGVTNAAGAVVTGESLGRAKALDLDPVIYLKEHNAFPFFHHLDDLLVTGPTGTNVNDLCFLITFK